MLKQKHIILASLFSVALLTTSCGGGRLAPIDNINHTMSKRYSPAQVRNAIYKAGDGRGWIMTDKGNGVIEAKMLARQHSATVRIPYSSTGYQIVYVKSDNLKEKDGRIHPNYNRWVRNLDKDIQIFLSRQGR